MTILRLANPVGRWQFDGKHGLVSKAVKVAHRGQTLNIYGHGQSMRDYFDADEISDFLLSSINKSRLKMGTFNIGSGKGHTETQIVRMVEEVTGRSIKRRVCAERDSDLAYAVLNYEKAKRELGWDPQVSILSTMQKLSKFMDV